MNRRTIMGLLRLFRPELPFSAGICTVLGEILAAGGVPGVRDLVVGFFSYFFLSSAALILNDLFDIETDRVNAPHRPLPSGQVTPGQVIVLSVVVTVLGITLSACAGPVAFALAISVWLLGVAYNWRLKRYGLLGNLVVSLSVGSTFIFGGVVVGRPWDPIVLWFGGLAFLLDLGEEIAADAMDVRGDALAGSRSLAIVWGQRAALVTSAVIFGLVIIVSLIPLAAGWLRPIYAIPLIGMDLVIAYATVRLLISRTERRRTYIRWIYLGATAAILIMIVMRIAG